MSDQQSFRVPQSGQDGDIFNRVEMRRRFSFLDDAFAQWREDLEGHVGIGLLLLPVLLCFVLLGALLDMPTYATSQSLIHWGFHWSLDCLLVLLYLPVGPMLVGISRYFLVHQRMRLRATEHAPGAVQTFTQADTVDAGKWADRPPFGLVVSGFRPLWPGLAALVIVFMVGVIPASLVLALGVWLGLHLHFVFAVPLYICAVLAGVGLTAIHLYAFHFIAETGLPAGEALKASRQAVKADPLLALGTVLIMLMIVGLGFLMCGVGLLMAIPAAWLVLTRAYLSLGDRPPDMALNEFDPRPPQGRAPSAAVPGADGSGGGVALQPATQSEGGSDPDESPATPDAFDPPEEPGAVAGFEPHRPAAASHEKSSAASNQSTAPAGPPDTLADPPPSKAPPASEAGGGV